MVARPIPKGEELSAVEEILAPVFLCSIFNRYSDDIRFLLRMTDVIGRLSSRRLPRGASWSGVEDAAFGASFATYVEAFLAPMIIVSRKWGFNEPPIFDPTSSGMTVTGSVLYDRWFKEASMPIEQAVSAFAERPLRSGLLGLAKGFFRTPFLNVRGQLIGISPWHMRDYASLGTWDKLNRACKSILRTDSVTEFSAAFGYAFEGWCGDLARQAVAGGPHPTEKLILPSRSGAEDEIEDAVFCDGDTVLLLSAKASLVPEASLKTADSPRDAVMWLRRFFFENVEEAKARGHRGGAVYLLDKKITMIRDGAFEERGIKRTATILPAVACFDEVGESAILYKWLEEESSKRRLLFRHGDVRPISIIGPDEFEALMAVRARGDGMCCTMLRKTEPRNKWRKMDDFLYNDVGARGELVFPGIRERFDALLSRSMDRLRPP
jgi:hypothetical protein